MCSTVEQRARVNHADKEKLVYKAGIYWRKGFDGVAGLSYLPAMTELVRKLIEKGVIVAPGSLHKLKIDRKNESLISRSNKKLKFPYVNGQVPDLSPVPAVVKSTIQASDNLQDYLPEKRGFLKRIRAQLRSVVIRDLSSSQARNAYQENIVRRLLSDSVFLSVGGGPLRQHPQMINLNIGHFPNVDVVGDAHLLPFASNSVDMIYCAAVMEHLERPHDAAREMYRVLKRGGCVYSDTPFLQAYHGFPHHYQNLTLTGHEFVYQNAGFRVVDSGINVGPTYAIIDLIGSYVREHLPKPLNKLIWICWVIIGKGVFVHLDKLVNRSAQAHIGASTTFVVARKT